MSSSDGSSITGWAARWTVDVAEGDAAAGGGELTRGELQEGGLTGAALLARPITHQ